jgi:hypothetical protein
MTARGVLEEGGGLSPRLALSLYLGGSSFLPS